MKDQDFELLRREFQDNCRKIEQLYKLIREEKNEEKQQHYLEQMRAIEPKVKQFMALTT